MKRTRFRAFAPLVGIMSGGQVMRAETWEDRNALNLVRPSTGHTPSKTVTARPPTITGSSFSWTLPDGNSSGFLYHRGSGTLRSLTEHSIDNVPIAATTANGKQFTSIMTTTSNTDLCSHGITGTGILAGATTLALSGIILGSTRYSSSGNITTTQGKVITGSNSSASHLNVGNGAACNFFADVITASSGLSADRTVTIPTRPDAHATFVVTTASPSSSTLLKHNSTAERNTLTTSAETALIIELPPSDAFGTFATTPSVTSPIYYSGSAGSDKFCLRSTSSGTHKPHLISFFTHAAETMRLGGTATRAVANDFITNDRVDAAQQPSCAPKKLVPPLFHLGLYAFVCSRQARVFFMSLPFCETVDSDRPDRHWCPLHRSLIS